MKAKECSKCGKECDSKYCPDCGNKMYDEQNDQMGKADYEGALEAVALLAKAGGELGEFELPDADPLQSSTIAKSTLGEAAEAIDAYPLVEGIFQSVSQIADGLKAVGNEERQTRRDLSTLAKSMLALAEKVEGVRQTVDALVNQPLGRRSVVAKAEGAASDQQGGGQAQDAPLLDLLAKSCMSSGLLSAHEAARLEFWVNRGARKPEDLAQVEPEFAQRCAMLLRMSNQ